MLHYGVWVSTLTFLFTGFLFSIVNIALTVLNTAHNPIGQAGGLEEDPARSSFIICVLFPQSSTGCVWVDSYVMSWLVCFQSSMCETSEEGRPGLIHCLILSKIGVGEAEKERKEKKGKAKGGKGWVNPKLSRPEHDGM